MTLPVSIVEKENILKGLPKERVTEELRNPSGLFPLYLVAARVKELEEMEKVVQAQMAEGRSSQQAGSVYERMVTEQPEISSQGSFAQNRPMSPGFPNVPSQIAAQPAPQPPQQPTQIPMAVAARGGYAGNLPTVRRALGGASLDALPMTEAGIMASAKEAQRAEMAKRYNYEKGRTGRDYDPLKYGLAALLAQRGKQSRELAAMGMPLVKRYGAADSPYGTGVSFVKRYANDGGYVNNLPTVRMQNPVGWLPGSSGTYAPAFTPPTSPSEREPYERGRPSFLGSSGPFPTPALRETSEIRERFDRLAAIPDPHSGVLRDLRTHYDILLSRGVNIAAPKSLLPQPDYSGTAVTDAGGDADAPVGIDPYAVDANVIKAAVEARKAADAEREADADAERAALSGDLGESISGASVQPDDVWRSPIVSRVDVDPPGRGFESVLDSAAIQESNLAVLENIPSQSSDEIKAGATKLIADLQLPVTDLINNSRETIKGMEQRSRDSIGRIEAVMADAKKFAKGGKLPEELQSQYVNDLLMTAGGALLGNPTWHQAGAAFIEAGMKVKDKYREDYAKSINTLLTNTTALETMRTDLANTTDTANIALAKSAYEYKTGAIAAGREYEDKAYAANLARGKLKVSIMAASAQNLAAMAQAYAAQHGRPDANERLLKDMQRTKYDELLAAERAAVTQEDQQAARAAMDEWFYSIDGKYSVSQWRELPWYEKHLKLLKSQATSYTAQGTPIKHRDDYQSAVEEAGAAWEKAKSAILDHEGVRKTFKLLYPGVKIDSAEGIELLQNIKQPDFEQAFLLANKKLKIQTDWARFYMEQFGSGIEGWGARIE